VLGVEEGSLIGYGLLAVYVGGRGVRFEKRFEAVFGKLESGSATLILHTNFLLYQGTPRKT